MYMHCFHLNPFPALFLFSLRLSPHRLCAVVLDFMVEILSQASGSPTVLTFTIGK